MQYCFGRMWFSECCSCNKMVALAWSEVKESTIQKCYAKAGIPDSACLFVANLIDEDPFSEIDRLCESMCKQWSWRSLLSGRIHQWRMWYPSTDFDSSDEGGKSSTITSYVQMKSMKLEMMAMKTKMTKWKNRTLNLKHTMRHVNIWKKSSEFGK